MDLQKCDETLNDEKVFDEYFFANLYKKDELIFLLTSDQLGLCLYVSLLIVSGAHVGAVEVSVGAHLMMQGFFIVCHYNQWFY